MGDDFLAGMGIGGVLVYLIMTVVSSVRDKRRERAEHKGTGP